MVVRGSSLDLGISIEKKTWGNGKGTYEVMERGFGVV